MSSHRLCGFALALCGVAGPAACGDPLTSCEQSVLPTCDAREADCQRALHEHVACARGVAAGEDVPTFSFLTPAEFAARYDVSTSLPAEMVQCLEIMELWPLGPVNDPLDATAVFDPDFRAVVVADGAAVSSILGPVVQAQRDAELGGFAAWRLEHGATFDQASALDALFAGEGRLFGDVAAFKTTPRDDAALRELVDTRLEDYDDAVRDLYAYARSDSYNLPQVDRHFPAIGARFALKTYLAQQPGALEEAYARPVRSGAELIRGRLTDTPPVEPQATATVPSSYTLRETERLGAWAYYSLLARLDPPSPPQPYEEVNDVEPQRFADVAGRWAGDRFDCYADAISGTPLVVWDLAFDPTVELGPFQITESTLATWRWVEREDSLTLVVGLDQAVVQSIVDGL